MSELSNEELKSLVAGLTARVSKLEGEVHRLMKNQEVPEDVLIAIGAAVSAYLGNKAKPRAVRYSGSRWANESRVRVHDRRVLHVR